MKKFEKNESDAIRGKKLLWTRLRDTHNHTKDIALYYTMDAGKTK